MGEDGEAKDKCEATWRVEASVVVVGHMNEATWHENRSEEGQNEEVRAERGV